MRERIHTTFTMRYTRRYATRYNTLGEDRTAVLITHLHADLYE